MTDVTFRAFRALVDYIYGKPLDRLEMIFLWEKVTKCFDKHLDRVFFDVLGLEAAARLLELAYAAEKYQVREIFKNEDRDFLRPQTRSPRTPPLCVQFCEKKINPHFFFGN